MKTYYVEMDVHRASIVMVVLNGAGKVVMQSVIETGAERVRGFLKQLRGKVYVTFEEGTQANWLHEVVRPLVTEVVVCDPRHNKLLQSGNKNDRVDAQKLAELLRNGALKAVYHGDNGVRALKELVRTYDCLVSDTTRVMNRLKALYRSWAIPCRGESVYAPRHRNEWLAQITEAGVRRRAEFYYQQLDSLRVLHRTVRHDLLAESQKHNAAKLLRQIPSIGPIRAALLIALIQTPHRFRTKRQLWAYSGLALKTSISGEHRVLQGQLKRSKKLLAIRGLNANHNHDLKTLLSGETFAVSVQAL